MGQHQLDSLDVQILKLIADNARIPFLEVARACNVSGAAIHQRIQKLANMGILYRAQNEAYKEVDGEKRRKALPVKELCVMAASGRAKRNVYIGLHSV